MAMVPMDYWLLTVPFGLFLDIIGFVIIIRFGHNLFIRTFRDFNNDESNGDILAVMPENISDADLSRDKRRRMYARIGVALVIAGFASQIIGSVAAILL